MIFCFYGLQKRLLLLCIPHNKPFPQVYDRYYLLMLNKDLDKASIIVNSTNNIPFEKKSEYQIGILLLNNHWIEASDFVSSNPNINTLKWTGLKSLTKEYQNIKYKSPFIAAGLSTILPGAGKVYTKNWKDGLFSLLFVASSAWQSYRGFNKNGVKSAYGWIFGAITIGLYGGNIFGSWKAAKVHNSNLNHEIYHQAEDIIFSDF